MPLPKLTSQIRISFQKIGAFPHIIPAFLVLTILVLAVAYSDHYFTNFEDSHVRALAPVLLSKDENRIVIQQAAFRKPDLLPVFGSSEMVNVATPYRAFYFFLSYPTGFNVFVVAKSGATSLVMAQDLAAGGPVLKGKKVVISFTPSMFNFLKAKEDAYAGNFSRIQANGFIYSHELSLGLKIRAAKRMLEYPETLINDPVLKFAVTNLAADNPYHICLFYLSYPLGLLDNFIFRMQDHWSIWQFTTKRGNITPVIKINPKKINWNLEISKAEAEQKNNILNTSSFAVDPEARSRNYNKIIQLKKPGSVDQTYLANLDKSSEWGDFEILLEVLKETGADPLILSRPINGTLYSAAGVSPKAQQVFYSKLLKLSTAFNFPLVDYQQFTFDPFFSVDFASHTSPKGWAIVDQTLNAFYHDQPLK